MKILLCSPIQKDAGIQNWGAPSLSIIRIAEYAKANLASNDVDFLFYDPQVDSFDPLERWISDRIDIVGISLLHYTLLDTLEFINKWKKIHPESLIVVGGNEAGANYQDIFDKSPTDIAVTAEGEKTFLDIIRWKLGILKLDWISGIVYRRYAQPIDDDSLWEFWKNVDFSKYRYNDYWRQIASLYKDPPYEKINYVRIVTTSHCQRQCTFCSLAFVRNIACGQFVKPASLKGYQIMRLVQNINRDIPTVRTIYFVSDDIFYPNSKDFLDFISIYKKSGFNYRILIQTSTYSIREEYFPLLKEINCQHITLGIENASERMRKSLGKPQSQEKIEQIVEWGAKYGIQIYFLIILMPPESTLEDLWINYEVISKWLKQGVQISIEPLIYAYRGSSIWEDTRYEFQYIKKHIPGTNLSLKDANYVLPKDLAVRELALEFKEKEHAFVEEKYKSLDHQHKFKGSTAPILLELLKALLDKYGPKKEIK